MFYMHEKKNTSNKTYAPSYTNIAVHLFIMRLIVIPTPEAARYSATGDPNPPATTTKIENLERFHCPGKHKENT